MKVSVLVPVYGVEKYIGRCAESLFAQTYKDIEYVFVDDCTPDRSMDVLRSVVSRHPVRQAQVKVIRNAVNSGIGAVRQTLIDNATGDCLTFVDSDDYLPPRAVELMCAEMGRGGVDIVDGAWQRVTSGGLSGVNTPCHECDDRRYLKLLLCQNIVSNRLWGRLYRRSLFTRNGVRLVPGIDYSEDYSVITRLMFHARRSFIDDVVYYYSDDGLCHAACAVLHHLKVGEDQLVVDGVNVSNRVHGLGLGHVLHHMMQVIDKYSNIFSLPSAEPFDAARRNQRAACSRSRSTQIPVSYI